MLEIRHLTSGYAGNEVLHNISMHVSPGEIVGLIGPNGAGKSTVLRSIFKLAQIKKGGITFKEHDITKLHTHDLLELGIGFVPQGRLVFSNLTVRENLRMGGFLLNNKDVVTRNMEDVLARFPALREKLHEKARNLSGGQQQMLAIGRALMMTPQLLLLDEPSLGLSPKATQELFEILKDINAAGPVVEVRHHAKGVQWSAQSAESNFHYRAGTTLMIVEQNVHLLLKFATRLYVLASGRIVAEGPPETFHDPSVLRKLYFQET